MLRGPHSGAAIAATIAAISIPSVAWYWMGSSQLQRVQTELRQSAQREAVTTAMQLAAKVALELDELRRVESDRVHLEYFPRFRSRGRRCGKEYTKGSPLATGDYPHSVKFYFQIDEQGTVWSPRVDDDLASLFVPLQTSFGKLGGGRNPRPGSSRRTNQSEPSGIVPSSVRPFHLQGLSSSNLSPGAAQSISPIEPNKAELLANFFNAANEADLPSTDDMHDVGDFKWMTGTWRSEPVLMAVRTIRHREHTFHQGFAIETRSFSDWMFDGGFPAKLLPGQADIAAAAMLPIGGIDWHVAFDTGPALQNVARQEATLKGQFRTSYFGGLFAAILAGAGVIVLVSRSGRFARERSRFAAAAAHELRTPLAGIRLHGEMLADSLGNPDSIARYSRRITDEAERLSRVVANVLSHARGEQRSITVNRELGDLAEPVIDCIGNTEPLLEESGVVLEVDLGRDLPQIPLDADAIHQILRNLLDNAEKYTRRATDRRVEVRLSAHGKGVRMSVIDHGPGLVAGLEGKLFKPFVNADTASKHAGLGLGLSVVKSLVEAHNGTVCHEPTPGGGATFYVDLPA